jgi:hypothetical protein
MFLRGIVRLSDLFGEIKVTQSVRNRRFSAAC